MKQTKIILPEDRIPKQWYNIIPDLNGPMAPVIHPGTLQPVTEIASICRENGVLCHTDAAQAIGSRCPAGRAGGTRARVTTRRTP